MPRPALALVAVCTALLLSGCSQPSDANDNTNSQQTDRTITPPTVIRTPVRVPTAPPTVPLPGPTGGAPGAAPDATDSFSPAPGGGSEQGAPDQG